jgi:iron complex outermembrane receptor protein
MKTPPPSLAALVLTGFALSNAQAEPANVLPEIVVSSPKLPQDLLAVPMSSTSMTGATIQDAGISTVKDAAFYAPNTVFSEFSARAVSNPRFRGLGGSPTNPAVTTYFDGVPQFNGYSSSVTLVDVQQVDFLRGPIGALYGRNSVGGLINVVSRKPSLSLWESEAEASYGSFNTYEVRGRVSAPLINNQIGLSIAGGYNARDGYTKNTVTGHDLDSRSSWFGKTQFLWQVNPDLEVRLLLSGESDRDGDYAIGLLSQLRQNPRQVTRDFEGYTHRDVFTPTLQITQHGNAVDVSSITGLVWWKTTDNTVTNYGTYGSPLTGAPGPTQGRELNTEKQTTWTQEFRFSNPVKEPISLGKDADLKWQAGILGFTQDYNQSMSYLSDLTNWYGPVFGSINSVFNNTLKDSGIGAYIQPTLTLWEKLDIAVGGRFDYEDKTADLNDGTATQQSRSFSRFTPQASLTYRACKYASAYFSYSSGYKAGGFNTSARVTNGAPGAYKEETSQNFEVGLKGTSESKSLSYQLAAFHSSWEKLQLNIPAYRYGIANAGNAEAFGVEGSVNVRVVKGWDVFGSVGVEQTTFLSGAKEGATNIAGNRLPYAPNHTAALGTQFSVELNKGWSAYARAEVQNTGGYKYDPINGESQDSYSIANFRLGVRNQHTFIEGFANNAFNEKYIPTAYKDSLGNYIGESGAPAIFGVRAGLTF